MIGTLEPSADPPEGPIGLPSGKPLLGYHFAKKHWDILGERGCQNGDNRNSQRELTKPGAQSA